MTTNLSQRQNNILTATDLAIKCFDYEVMITPNAESRKAIIETMEEWRGKHLVSSYFTMSFIHHQVAERIANNIALKRFLFNFDARLRLSWADMYPIYTLAVIQSHCNRAEISDSLFYLLDKNMERALHVNEKDLTEFSSANPWYIGLYLVLANLGHSTLKVMTP